MSSVIIVAVKALSFSGRLSVSVRMRSFTAALISLYGP
jgi:hypothetical protein